MAIDSETNLEQAFEDYVQACRARAEVARQAGRRADVEAQLLSCRAAELSRDQDEAARATAEHQLLEVAEAADCEAPSVDELPNVLRDWVRAQEELDKIRQEQDKRRARLDQLLDGVTIGALEAEIAELVASAGHPLSDDAPALNDRSSERERLQELARQRQEALSELVGKIESAEGHLLDVSQAIEAEARAAAEVSRLKALEEVLDLTGEILRAAQEKVHADIAPVLNQTIRPWVSRITLGRYDDIRVNPATLGIEAHEASGQFRAATVLSHGTTEQLFLLLRLALAQRLTTTGEKAPIVLDDITVQSDTNRTLAALDLLQALSQDHQVVLFSQEDEVLRWASERPSVPSDRLIRLNT